jgi:hypothetical protein
MLINIYHKFTGVLIYGRGGVQEGKSGMGALGIETFHPYISKLTGKLRILVRVQFTVSAMHDYGSNKT